MLCPYVVSVVDDKPCTEYRDIRTKRKMARDGDLTREVHCAGFGDGECRCQPCAVCAKRICPDGPEAAPSTSGNNGVWIGVHCFVCFQRDRPRWANGYNVAVRDAVAQEGVRR